MKVIIAGGREINDYDLLLQAVLNAGFDITAVVSGGARGVDAMGERFAEETGLQLFKFPAEWDKYKRAAGPIRNRVMAEFGDALIAIWDGKSSGTKNMIDQAREHGLKVHVEMTYAVDTERSTG
jgi:predicted Rossmann fold nucleotide-binding protein DprA/Smf involved in DNA uptake